jgi:diguanylate cyclase
MASLNLDVKRSVSISVQISRVVMITAFTAVLLTMLAMIVVAALLAQHTAQQRAHTIADLLAASADVPLVLRDAERGREVLSALSSSDGVLRASLIDRDGHPLASYLNKPQQSERAATLLDRAWAGDPFGLVGIGDITARRPVTDRGDLLGYAEVTIREQQLSRALAGFVAAGAAVLALITLVWLLISARIGRSLSLPLTRVSEVTRKIRDTEEFSHRLPSTHVQEVRALSDDFNALLDVIQRRTSEVNERNRELARLAFYDPLTGAANRVLLLDRMTQLIDAFGRNGQPFAVLAFDLDHFKVLNDQLGHQVGDAFLKSMSQRCKAELRRVDTFARLGGDEFIALLPGVATESAGLLVAKQLAAAVHAANHVHSLPISCTASIGIGLYPKDGQSTNELMARADAAMYEAKSQGRDQIRFVREIVALEPNERVTHDH